MSRLESQSKKYLLLLLFVLFFPNIVMFIVPLLHKAFGFNLLEHYALIMEGTNYIARAVLAISLFFDIRKSLMLGLIILILVLTFLNPFMATALYFVAEFLYKPQKLKA